MVRPKSYLEVFKNRDFFILILTVFLGQIASAFLVLSLITSVFTRTGSNFGVSGIILSVTIPSLILMAFAGLASDVFDRKKIIILINFLITIIVLLILFTINNVVLTIILSFLYFATNSFFYPAVSAATAQLVDRQKLADANSAFFLTLAGGQIFGFFLASVSQFLLGSGALLVISEMVLLVAIVLPIFLPPLNPRETKAASLAAAIGDIWKFITYVFRAKTTWFYFLILAASQGIIAFGATLAPGFFDDVVGLAITKSPLFIFPPVAVGIISGALFKPKISEGFKVALGFSIVGATTAILGLLVILNLEYQYLIPVVLIYLMTASFGLIFLMVASRTVLQRRVAHQFQGTIFGANFVASAFFATIASPISAFGVAIFDYGNVLAVCGLLFLIAAFVVSLMRKRWNF